MKCTGNEGLMANSKKIDPRKILGGTPPPGIATHGYSFPTGRGDKVSLIKWSC